MLYRTEYIAEAVTANKSRSEMKIGNSRRAVWTLCGTSPVHFLRFGFNMPGEPAFFGTFDHSSAPLESVSLLVVKRDQDPEILLFGFRTYDWSEGKFTLAYRDNEYVVTAYEDYDHYRLSPGESAGSDETVVLKGRDFNLLVRQWAELVASHTGRRMPPEIPTGWNDWQFYRNRKKAQDLLDSCDALKIMKEQGWPIQFIQIDGGYALHLSEWREPHPEFGMGIKALSDYIRNAGFRFGLWFAPYIQNIRTRVVREHPEWMLNDESGRPVLLENSNVGTSRLVDYTVPGTLEWLRGEIRFLVGEWHVEWLKLDGPNITTYRQGVLRDPKCTFQQMMRRTFEVIREAAGDVLVEGEGSMTAAAGLVDLQRVQKDNHMRWFTGNDRNRPYAPQVYGKELIMSFLHGVWWCNHRENIILRDYPSPFAIETEQNPDLAEQLFSGNERKVQLASAMIAPGGLLLTDPMKELIRRPELLAPARMLFPPENGTAEILDPFPEDHSPYPHWVHLNTGTRHYLAVFNWGDTTRDFPIPERFLESEMKSLFTGKVYHECKSVFLGARSAEIVEITACKTE